MVKKRRQLKKNPLPSFEDEYMKKLTTVNFARQDTTCY